MDTKDEHQRTKYLLEAIRLRSRRKDEWEQDQVGNAVQAAVALKRAEIDQLKHSHTHANFELELAHKNLKSAAEEKGSLLEVIRQLKEENSEKAFHNGRQSMMDEAQDVMLKPLQNLNPKKSSEWM